MFKFADQPDVGKLILRLSLGILLLLHGFAKLPFMSGLGGVEGLLAKAGLPGFLAFGAYVGEIIAPLMLILGWKVRIAGILVIGNMLFAIGTTVGFKALSIGPMGGFLGELPLLFLFASLAVVFLGAGKYSIGCCGTRPARGLKDGSKGCSCCG